MDGQMVKVYEFFRQQGFLPINRDSYSVFKSYEKYSTLQEMSATMITTWSFVYNGLYKIISGYLCGVYFYPGRPVNFTIHRPDENPECSLGKLIAILYALSMEAGLPFFQIKFIEERFLSDFESFESPVHLHVESGGLKYDIKTESRENAHEYVYKIQDFIELSGGVNLIKRQRLNKCFKLQDMSFRSITRENIRLCLTIEEQWCRHRDCTVCESFTGCEKKALEIMTALFDDSCHKGLLLYREDTPVGYCIGEIISEKLAFAYYGKSIHENGFLYLLYTMAKTLFAPVEYLNLNEDMGNEGIRQFKRHLGVYSQQRKYICTFTNRDEKKG
jgi:hypothetical protein